LHEVELEVKKFQVQGIRLKEDHAVKRVKIDISQQKVMDGVTLREREQ
jgi:hypothetical protein